MKYHPKKVGQKNVGGHFIGEGLVSFIQYRK